MRCKGLVRKLMGHRHIVRVAQVTLFALFAGFAVQLLSPPVEHREGKRG